ncbi:FixH family protein [Nitratiruptor tergarcus]|uniref:YtkA-like n=1 Tax=Nitratiruptor tergarcus DSM 16512 TaxID=1069081 RepID=A0A1W1WTR3_9BACT|nr:FixH family protein [Nitratiruptor tergarcus]SMC09708.1 YtkA-like [Nitratiruptor tergarcus DSM 16512]
MKKLAILVLGAILLFAAGFQKHVKYRGFKIDIISTKPLSVGANSFLFHINKKNIKDLKVKFFMPAMPGMPYMESWAKIEKNDQGYQANVKLPMAGTWQVHIFITTNSGKKYRIKTSVNI